MKNRHLLPYLVLLTGVSIVSSSSIFIRFVQAEETPSLVIASWRLMIAVMILTPVAWSRRGAELCSIGRNGFSWSVISGLFLAAHLASWITSLAYTSVASSTALVCTYPLWVALMEFLIFKERLSGYTITGLAAAFTGMLLITFSDSGVLRIDPAYPALIRFNWHNLISHAGKADAAIFGNGLALLGGLTGAGYFLVGRHLRRHMSNIAYIWPVYTTAMVALVIVTLLAGQPLAGHSTKVYMWLILIAIGPQLLGHTAFNWVLAHLSTTFVVLTILGEPVGSAILAYFVFGETFAFLQLTGFILLLFGIGFGVIGERK